MQAYVAARVSYHYKPDEVGSVSSMTETRETCPRTLHAGHACRKCQHLVANRIRVRRNERPNRMRCYVACRGISIDPVQLAF